MFPIYSQETEDFLFSPLCVYGTFNEIKLAIKMNLFLDIWYREFYC